MKKVLAILVVFLLGFSIFGICGAESEPITLTMMRSGPKAAGTDFFLDTLPKLVKEKFPNITLETSKLPDEQYLTAIRTKLASGEAPDIFLVWPKTASCGVIDMAKAGYVMNLSGMGFWKNFGKGAISDMSYNGKPYAVADGLDFLGVYYNQDYFKKVGISAVPKDWSSFLNACKKLKAAGIIPIVLGDKDPWYIQFGMYQVAANVVYPGDMDFDKKLQEGQATFSKSKWVKTIAMYKELYAKGYIVKNSLGISGAQAAQMFIDGKAAMAFDGTWDYSALTSKGAVDFKRGFFPLPANDPSKPVYISAATSTGYAINAKTKYPEAVKQVFEYMYDGKSPLFKAWSSSSNSICVFKGVPLQHDLYKEIYNLYQESGKSVYFCNQMWPSGVAEEMEAKFAEIIGGRNTSPVDVAKAMDIKFANLWKK